jgi:Zn-dependent protease
MSPENAAAGEAEAGQSEPRKDESEQSSDDDRGEVVASAVLSALRQLESPKVNWQQGLLVLGATAALFVAAQGFQGATPWQEIALLVVVLVLHELGHLAAMRLFGFRDLRMFFLPFFGAAASGKKLDATATQRALVSLAGPVPSIVLAVLICIGAAIAGVPVDISSAEPFPRFILMMFIVNMFNLLPIEPLDGGAFLRVVLMARVPLVRVAFRVVAGIALAALAFAFKDWIWAMLAGFVLISCPHQYALAKSARLLRAELDQADVRPASDGIPDAHLGMVANRVRADVQTGDKQLQPRQFAASMHAIWQLAHERSPRWLATAGLLALYAVMVAPAIFVVVFAAMPAAPVEVPPDTPPPFTPAPESPEPR